MKQYLTSGEAARACGAHINTVKSWAKKGEFEVIYSPTGRWRILTVSFIAFLEKNHIALPKEYTDYAYRILVVDDDPSVAVLVRGAMSHSRLSCKVFSALDGYSGLLKVGELKPDLLVLDIMMPEMNGIEVLQHLAADRARLNDLRIVVLTGAQENIEVLKLIEAAKPDALLFKPVHIVSLLEEIQQILLSIPKASKRVLEEVSGG